MGTLPYLRDLGSIGMDLRQRELWKLGALPKAWALRFPFLFDDRDLSNATNQCASGQHFVEWLAAIILHHATGFHALIKYEFKVHERKRQIISALLPASVINVIDNRPRPAQCPDLIMYAPDLSEWFFCEVKGPRDHLRPPQHIVFQQLAEASSKPVSLLTFTDLRRGASAQSK